MIAPALDPLFVCNSLRRLPGIEAVRRTEVVANENDFAIRAAQKLAAKACRKWLPEFKKLANKDTINRIQFHEIGDEISCRHKTDNYYTSEKVRCIHLKMLNRIYAAQQQPELPAAMAEFNSIESEPVSSLDESGFIIDLPPTDTVSEVLIMAEPVGLVPSQDSN